MIPTKPMHLNVTLHLGDFNCPSTESNIDIAARRIGFPLVCVKAARTKYSFIIGVKKIVRYTDDCVKQRFVKSRFDCNKQYPVHTCSLFRFFKSLKTGCCSFKSLLLWKLLKHNDGRVIRNLIKLIPSDSSAIGTNSILSLGAHQAQFCVPPEPQCRNVTKERRPVFALDSI